MLRYCRIKKYKDCPKSAWYVWTDQVGRIVRCYYLMQHSVALHGCTVGGWATMTRALVQSVGGLRRTSPVTQLFVGQLLCCARNWVSGWPIYTWLQWRRHECAVLRGRGCVSARAQGGFVQQAQHLGRFAVFVCVLSRCSSISSDHIVSYHVRNLLCAHY